MAAPASNIAGAGVLLLKDRNTSSNNKQDSYEAALTAAGFRCRFVAPLSFVFPEEAQRTLVHILRRGPLLSGRLAFVATSPRGVDALVQALQKAAAASDGWSPSRLRALWEGRLVFVVGEASATHLRAHDDLAGQCGFRAEVCPSGANAAELGRHLRARSSELFEAALVARNKPSPASVAAMPDSFDHLAVLVGDHRREEIFEVLRGQTAEAPRQSIPHMELIVYHTLVAEASSVEAVVEDGPAALDAASPFLKQLLTHLLDLGSSSSTPIFIAFFSPSGVDTFFSQLLLAPAPVAKQIAPFVARFRFACIGQTSAAALADQRRELPQLDWLRQAPAAVVAAKPNAEEMLRCLQAAVEGSSMASSSSSASASASSLSPPAPSSLVSIPFFKYHGTLNDYVLLDGFVRHYTPSQLAQIARDLCSDRRGAIGSDGLLYVTSGRERLLTSDPASLLDVDPSKAHIHGRMRMYNVDGSEAEMCGNGLRCVAKFVYDHKCAQPRPAALNLLTGAGEKTARVVADPVTGLAAQISLDLGRPVLDSSLASVQQLLVHDVSMGNPHCIVLLPGADPASVLRASHVDQVDVDRWGKLLHDDLRYMSTHGTNVSFVSIRPNGAEGSSNSNASAASASPVPISSPVLPASPSVSLPPAPVLTVDIRTYERGNGETWSCGSGISATVSSVLARRPAASASASSAFVPVGGYPETVRVFVRGGELSVTCWLKDRPAASASSSDFLLRDVLRVQLTGPATEVFEGKFPLQLQA